MIATRRASSAPPGVARPSTAGSPGACGGFTAARGEIVALLRQRSRPYLFSNTLPPGLVCASLACLELLSRTSAHRDRLAANTRWFRRAMSEAGFQIRPGEHPIVPIMLGDPRLAHQISSLHQCPHALLQEEGIALRALDQGPGEGCQARIIP